MIETELSICEEDVTCFYEMNAGEVTRLDVQLPDGDLVNMSELLEFNHIYSAIEAHYENMIAEANIES